MSQRTEGAALAQQETGIRYEAKPLHHGDCHTERARRIQLYASQVAAATVTKSTFDFRLSGYIRAVECVDTGTQYQSTSAAGKALGISTANIRQAIRNGGKTAGLRFRYAAGAQPMPRVTAQWRPVVCVESGAEFPSLSAAAKAIGMPLQTLFDCVRKGTPARDGRRYTYKAAGKAA